MQTMISVASEFQHSINIAYDLNDDGKLNSFIPTSSFFELLRDILLSTNKNSTERARILIGAYGKGKSHIVLAIITMLMGRNLKTYTNVLPKLKEDKKLYQQVRNFYDEKRKFLPVIISGNNGSLTQAFLYSLQVALKENGLENVMPKTNFEAAVRAISRWQDSYPETLKKFEKLLDCSLDDYIDSLKAFDVESYRFFETVYPDLTSGSSFNPFLGFDVVELYANVSAEIKKKGYNGIYVVYDEFSKFLEANIAQTSVSDTKMLQDFAERCNRSGANQLHLMLISHKEISNYIDKLPKAKVDGWRGISERFSHIHLDNDSSQTYEIISTVIQKKAKLWESFLKANKSRFKKLVSQYGEDEIFSDLDRSTIESVITSCYPLHPASIFILPRLSEKVAQNERTLFTFLSAKGGACLSSCLDKQRDNSFFLVTPDVLYDYFEPLFQKEIYVAEIHDQYRLTKQILNNLNPKSLETKIVKSISLIYMLAQFEKIKPLKATIESIYSSEYRLDEIEAALSNLIEKKFVLYFKRSNSYLKLKDYSGLDTRQLLKDEMERLKNDVSIKDVLNSLNYDNFVYPSRYNDDNEMTRFFSFIFINASEISDEFEYEEIIQKRNADGAVFAILLDSDESIKQIRQNVLLFSKKIQRCVFVLPKHRSDYFPQVLEYYAASVLKDKYADDPILFDEFDIIYEDLRDVLLSFVMSYSRPELMRNTTIYMGDEWEVSRKTELTALLSDICDDVFKKTPIINNEVINKNEPSTMALNSRNKVIKALLRNELEPKLGLTGNGQDVSIMRSCLMRTGILDNSDSYAQLCLTPPDKNLSFVLATIQSFVDGAKKKGDCSFDALYAKLMNPAGKIGLRRGLIPLFIAVVFHECKKEIILSDNDGNQLPISMESLVLIDSEPSNYVLSAMEWDSEKERYVQDLTKVYEDFVIEQEKGANNYGYILSAIKRWFVSLPKYTKTIAANETTASKFVKILSSNKSDSATIFVEIPALYGYKKNYSKELISSIATTKAFFDNCLNEKKNELADKLKEKLFSGEKSLLKKTSLKSVSKDWIESLDEQIGKQVFANGTDKFVSLMKNDNLDIYSLLDRLAKIATDLRIEDWNESCEELFFERIDEYKATAEEFSWKKSNASRGKKSGSSYELNFVDENGKLVTKCFDRVPLSGRSQLLANTVKSAIESFGQSVSENEIRQVVVDILQKMCDR